MNKLITASLKKGQSGMALPMALILLVVASLIVVPSLWAVQSLLTINSNVSKDTQAYYAADAGIVDLVWKYKYGIAPTSSYTVNNVNGMNADVSLIKTSGQDYYWMSSAPSGMASKAQVYVHVQQTGSQGNNVFDQTVASLDGNITMSGTCKVTSDDTYIIDYCDSAWTRSYNTVTCSAVSSPRETGVFYDTGASARMVMTEAVAVGNLAYRNTGTKDISPYSKISLWIQSSVPLNSGDMRFMIATGTKLSGSVQSIDIPAIPANTGTRVMLTVSNPSSYSALQSIGVYQAVDKGAFTLYIDNVIATNNISNGDVYANGNISIIPSATVNGDASATGTITDSQNGISGTETPNAPKWTPQLINIDQYKNEANIKGGTVYQTLSTAWNTSDLGQITVNGNANINWSSYNITMGPAWIGGNLNISTNTITMGPTYVVGDMTISGSSIATLKGTVYVGGTLSISGSALVQGPYTIVAKTIMVSGDSGVQLDKGEVPFIIAYNGDFTISGSSQISAVIYAPYGTANISGGTNSLGYNVYGAVVAKSVVMSGSTTIEYMTGIQTLPWPPGWGLGGGPAGGGGTTSTTVVGYAYQ